MPDTPLSKFLDKTMTRKEFLKVTALGVISMFGIFGTITELMTHADTPNANVANEGNTGNATLSSSKAALRPVNNALPAISGSPVVGDILKVTKGTWFDSPTGYTYQWRRIGLDIPGTTSSSYAPNTYDVGKEISCAVTAKNAAGSTTVLAAPTAEVTAPGFFTDNFSGTSLNTTFWQNGYRQGAAAGIAATDASNVSVSDGKLILKGTGPNGAYTGVATDYSTGGISTPVTFGPYATVTVVAKMSKGVGMWPAIWFVGDSEELNPKNWPEPDEHYEFDLQECPQTASGDEGTDIHTAHQTYHFTPTTLVNGERVEHNLGITVDLGTDVDLSADFHTYECQWNEAKIVFLLDGKVRKTLLAANVDICPNKAVLFLTNQINNAPWNGSLKTKPNPTTVIPNASTVFPASMIVSSVAITAPPLL